MKQSQHPRQEPLVSVGIPLYRSSRFIDNLIRNVDAITYGNVEIIISDRHCLDDTIDKLRERYGHDPRFKFFKHVDRINWVDHYNSLLKLFSGKYSLWMPHDDIYPGNYIGLLVKCLEQHPDTICAFGCMQKVDISGLPLPSDYGPPPISSTDPRSISDVIKLFYFNPAKGFRGLFRRNFIVENRLFLNNTLETNAADGCWMFRLSLLGRLRYVSNCFCKKRFYATSTHSLWKISIRKRVERCRILWSYLKETHFNRIEVSILTTVVFVTIMYRCLPKRLRLKLSGNIVKIIKTGLYWMLR